MTQQERLIISAYTGYAMTDWNLVHKFIEEKMGRPVFTHELAHDGFTRKLQEKLKPEFLALCGK